MTFSYTATGVTECAISAPIEMIAPAQGFASPKEGENSGSWVELRDEDGGVLFHRRVHDPFRRYVEGYADGKIIPAAREVEPDEFEVVVPDLADVKAIAVVSSELRPAVERDAGEGAATTIRTFGVSPEGWG